jgi:2-oxoglutarate dehydrogenase E2 component (dihydrolipoamide succinyltransferase)
MPQLGETVTEGTILRWAKQVGDTVAEDEVLVEISTDKVDTEVPSPAAGTILEILVAEGDTVSVGTPLVVIGAEGEEATTADDAGEEAAAEEEPAQEETPAEEASAPAEPASEEEKPAAEESEEPAAEEAATAEPEEKQKPSEPEVDSFFAEPDETEKKPNLLSPVVRRLIRENEIDVSRVTGSGEGGRITRKDVEAFMASGAAEKEAPPPAEPEPTPPEAPAAEPAPAEKAPAPAAAAATAPAGPGAEEIELDRVRVRTAENMIKARQTAAHVWTSVEVDFERVERVRQARKDQFKKTEGFSLTYLPFISRATIDALRAFPVVNSSFDLEGKKAVFHGNIDLGIAVDLDQKGLVVPRVRNADGLRLVGIARSIRDLADRARDGKLGVDDLTGSTFTITNPGPFGSFMSAPIINVPNVAILSTDTVAKRPTVVTSSDGQDMIAIRHIGYLGLTWDHRAFDGSTAVLFLQKIKQNIETWDWEQELA